MTEITRLIASAGQRRAWLSRLAIAALLPAQCAVGARAIHDYEPAVVTLRGTVVLTPERGPPGYGENASDPIEEFEILHTQPFDVRGKPDDALDESENAIDAVQLFRDKFRGALRGCMDVSGTLFHAHTGHHHTRVLLDVSAAQAADDCAAVGSDRAAQPHSFARAATTAHGPVVSTAPSAPPPNGVADLFRNLPQSLVDYPVAERQRLLGAQSGRLIADDAANGYLAISGDGAAPGFVLALFKQGFATPVLAVQRYDEAGETTRFLIERDGQWADASSDLVPGYATTLHYELPRHGNVVKVGAAGGAPSYELRPDGARFARVAR